MFPPPPAPVLSCTGIQYPVRLPPHSDEKPELRSMHKKHPAAVEVLPHSKWALVKAHLLKPGDVVNKANE